MPVGRAIPLGYYDFPHGSWLPAGNGRVIKVLGELGTLALLDVDGTGTAASDKALAAMGITPGERLKLAQMYAPGQELWRSAITHLTPWDTNFPYGPEREPDMPIAPTPPTDPADAMEPPTGSGDDDPAEDDSDKDDEDEDCEEGSIIDCTNARLGESIDIPGTPIELVYRGERNTGGQGTSFKASVRISSGVIPRQLVDITSEICVAGRCDNNTVPPSANLIHRFFWDGNDAYGRSWQGPVEFVARAGYTYPLVYHETFDDFEQSWAGLSGIPMTRRNSVAVTMWGQYSNDVAVSHKPRTLGAWSAEGLGFGGWSVSIHHVFDPESQMVYYGDGRRRAISGVADAGIATIEPYTQRDSSAQSRFATGADGSLYTIYYPQTLQAVMQPQGVLYRQRVQAYRPGSTEIVDIADNCPPHPDSDYRCDDGSTPLWNTAHRMLVDETDRIVLVAETGIFRLDGAGWTSLTSKTPAGHSCVIGPAAALSGRRLYFTCTDESGFDRLLSLWPDGQVTNVAGGGNAVGADVSAQEAQFAGIREIVVAPDGNLYIAEPDNYRVRRVGISGRVATVAGTGTSDFSADGSIASESPLSEVRALTVTRDGVVIFAESGRIREVKANGQLQTLLGGGNATVSSRTQSVGGAVSVSPRSIESLPDGSLVFDTYGAGVVRWIRSGFNLDNPESTFTIASETGSDLFIFDRVGRHTQTRDAISGSIRYLFRYSSSGLLTEIEDGSGNVTRVERDAKGSPTAIIGPFGVTTTLTLDADGFLSAVDPPVVDPWSMAYKPGYPGLLEEFTDPRGHASSFEWAVDGRLISDTDAEGGVKQVEREKWGSLQARLSTLTTATGRTKKSFRADGFYGPYRGSMARPDGGGRSFERLPDYSLYEEHVSGLESESRFEADPRYGLQAPVGAVQISSIGGLTTGWSTTRSASVAGDGQFDLADTLVIDGRNYLRNYAADNRTWTYTSPMGRVLSVVVDAKSRPVVRSVSGIAPIEYSYDTLGHLVGMAQGAGVDRREWVFGYDSNGYRNSVQDPLNRIITLENDELGRTLVQRTPDNRAIRFAYDDAGNMTVVGPPGRPDHEFVYDKVNKAVRYQPPSLGAGIVDSVYSRNLDREVTGVVDPDGRSFSRALDSTTGLPSQYDLQGESRAYTYDVGGLLHTISSSGGTGITFARMGAVYAGYTATGPVAGKVDLLRGGGR
jgi:YD repeat-containing protein